VKQVGILCFFLEYRHLDKGNNNVYVLEPSCVRKQWQMCQFAVIIIMDQFFFMDRFLYLLCDIYPWGTGFHLCHQFHVLLVIKCGWNLS
jgi:hypothetical protein